MNALGTRREIYFSISPQNDLKIDLQNKMNWKSEIDNRSEAKTLFNKSMVKHGINQKCVV